MRDDNFQIRLTPGGFPDLLGDPDSPRSVADLSSHHSVIDLAGSKADMTHRDDDDTLLDDILDDESDGEAEDVEEVETFREPRKIHFQNRRSVTALKNPSHATRHTPKYYGEEKKEDDRVETLRNEFDRQAFVSVEHEYEDAIEDAGEDAYASEEECYEDEEENDDGVGEDDEDDDESEDDDDKSVRSETSATVVDLLERAHDRIHMQQLHDEIENLKGVVERKNVELENLTGQLRRAVATKCDLVLAHTELELHHEHNLKKREMGLKELGKVNRGLLEEQSMVEVELLNEIALLTNKIHEQQEAQKKEIQTLEQQHSTACSNRDRLHANEIKLKNSQIAKLQEEVRVLKGGSPAATVQKKGGLLSFIPIQKQ